MSVITRTDVTAVKFYNNYVLAGIGNELHVFDKRSNNFVCKLEVLIGQKIYGFVISKCKQKVLVFGGKQFSVLKLKSEHGGKVEVFGRCFTPTSCNDWLHSAIWIEENTVAVLTAHNVVQKWDISTPELISSHPSKDNSILYSGLLLPLQTDVLVMAGTVFSEVIIHKCDEEPLHRLTGHKGVIFSISCEPDKNIIVTTSDDRSVRIWGPRITPEFANTTINYWRALEIVCKHELYGHLARVMRSCITNNYVVSVGEDSGICTWDFQGTLVKKTTAHQNGCIWAVDYCDDVLVTGGGDCGVILHPLAITDDYCDSQTINVDVGIPKKVVLTAKGNVVILSEGDNLIHYNVENKNAACYKLNHKSTYKLMSISSCKQMITVADMTGNFDLFAESCKHEPSLFNIINTKLHLGKILSMHWAGNRHLVMCSENGKINVLAYGTTTGIYDIFTLPPCKERWLTSAAVKPQGNMFVLGDRCGNIHVYIKGRRAPITTFSKVHGRYGPTSITIQEKMVITTGRNGAIKYFHVDPNANVFRYMDKKDLEFQWVEKFIDKDQNLVCGFQERVFVVHNLRDSSVVLEEPCGGGHRSWDVQRSTEKVEDTFEQIVQLVYVKNSEIHLKKYFLSKLMPVNLINGSHSKEINCLKVYRNISDSKTYYISGGEDTTLRISSVDDNLRFRDEFVFKQLSSVRALRICPINSNNILLISAGGRAQIKIRNIKFPKSQGKSKVNSLELVDYLIKGTDNERKGNQSWRTCTVDFDPETRIMDIDMIKDLFIFAGCSDAVLRIFTLKDTLKLVKEVKYHDTCILKTHCFKFSEKNILATATTRGDVALWLVNDIDSEFRPFLVLKTRESGVNSIATKVLRDTLIIATGGDDNSILMQLLRTSIQGDVTSLAVECSWSSCSYHSSQITSVILFSLPYQDECDLITKNVCRSNHYGLTALGTEKSLSTSDHHGSCMAGEYSPRTTDQQDLTCCTGDISSSSFIHQSPQIIGRFKATGQENLTSSSVEDSCSHGLHITGELLTSDQKDLTSMPVQSSCISTNPHRSDEIGDSPEGVLLTTSIDQRITLFRWSLKDGLKCAYERQIYSNVADIHGMDIVQVSRESIRICVFGKGLEVVDIPLPKQL